MPFRQILFFLILVAVPLSGTATDLEKAVDLRKTEQFSKAEQVLKKYSSPAKFDSLNRFSPVFSEEAIINKELNGLERKYEFSKALKMMESHIKEFPDDYVIQFQIANYFFYGRKGVDINKQKARKLYITLLQSLISMQDKSPEVLYIIGIAVSNSSGNTVSAFKWLMESAGKDYPPAEAEIAFRYMKGIGVRINIEQAAQWSKKAMEHGNSLGQAIYGAYLLNVKKKSTEGYHLIQKSADTGNAGGLYMLFYCLYYGKGCKVNKDMALKYLELSSYQGFADAISKLQILRKYVK